MKQFVDENGYNIRKTFIQELHSGCVDFAADFTKYFHSFFETMFIAPELATRILENFSKNALPLDLDIIQGVSFDDKVGGVSQRSMSELIKKSESLVKDVKKQESDDLHTKRPIISAFDKAKPEKIELSKERTMAVNNDVKLEKVYTKKYNNLVMSIEEIIIKKIFSKRKYDKYLKDRDLFFQDSSSKLAKCWYNYIK